MPKNQSLPAVSDFRRDFPQFADPAKYPEAQIQFRLNLADELLSENVTGKKLFPYFAGLFVAHYMTLWAADSRAMLAGGPGGSTNGVQSSKSVDKVAVLSASLSQVSISAGIPTGLDMIRVYGRGHTILIPDTCTSAMKLIVSSLKRRLRLITGTDGMIRFRQFLTRRQQDPGCECR